MSDYVAALGTVIAVFVMLRAERKDIAGELRRIDTRIDTLDTTLSSRIDTLDTTLSSRIDTLDTRLSSRIETLDTKMSARIEALDTKLSSRLDTVVLELGKTFGRPTNRPQAG